MALDKSSWDTKVKVSQATIDKIKQMGMSGALKSVGSSKDTAFVEGVKRMYGANRVAAASKSSSTGTSQYRAGERASTPTKTTSSTSAKPASSKSYAQKDIYGNKTNSSVNVRTPAAKPKAPAKPYVAPKKSTPSVATRNTSGSVKQTDMYGNRIGSNVNISSAKKTVKKSNPAKPYKAPVQKDMYGNKIK
jgi:hypothetical protein